MKQTREDITLLCGSEFVKGIRKETLNALLDKYRFIGSLGAGGNASVFKAFRYSDSRNVALKVLHCGTDEKKARFHSEIVVLKEYGTKISGVMPIGECSDNEHEHWYDMPITQPVVEFIEEIANDNERLRKSVEIVLECARTLAFLHERGVSHRDIKPDNIHIYEGNVVIGDFGLVHLPDSDNKTRSDAPLGPGFAMAPEMRRNPQTADGKKADVYCLAKTLWMLIMNDRKGFDGPYNWLDSKISLGKLSTQDMKLHLAGIELLIGEATDNDPERRPSMHSFIQRLEEWQTEESDTLKLQIAEWKFLKQVIYGQCIPSSSVFTDMKNIRIILEALSRTVAANHTLFPSYGGLDFIGVSQASEPGCLELKFDLDTVIIKPRLLQVGIFEDSELNYFLLEAEQLEAISGIEEEEGLQHLIEDTPGHYIYTSDAVYGVYDYDRGDPLPKDARSVTRIIKGRLLMVFKSGPYNAIAETYDGRHNDCPIEHFHNYILSIERKLKEIKSSGRDWRELNLSCLDDISRNPFKSQMDKEQSEVIFQQNATCVSRKDITSWDLSSVFEQSHVENSCGGNYTIVLAPSEFDLSHEEHNVKNEYILSVDGHLYDSCSKVAAFKIERLSDARKLIPMLEESMRNLVSGINLEYNFNVRVNSLLSNETSFDANRILMMATKADDRKGNRFVIDDDGELKLLEGAEGKWCRLYPVRMEFFEPRKKNVGKYSRWDANVANRYEVSLKKAWSEYCNSLQFQHCDSY